MFFPFAVLVGLVVVARIITKSPDNPAIKVGANYRLEDHSAVFQTQVLPPNITRVINLIHSGVEPDAWLIDAAISEAYTAGRWDVVDSLSQRFLGHGTTEHRRDESQDSSPSQADSIGIVIGKNSPFDGVSNEAWTNFVSRLETQPEDFSSPKHVGRYHHSRARLQQLGIDDDNLKCADHQYDALAKDFQDYREREEGASLIAEFNCLPIVVNGTEHVITTSGILSLLKAAGPSKARSWLTNETDRVQFPKTTEMFLQTNGIF